MARRPPRYVTEITEQHRQKIIKDANVNGTQGGNGISATEHKVYELADTGNGDRFADQHGTDIRYVYKWGKHLVWTRKVWEIDRRGEVSRRAQQTARSIHVDAASEGLSQKEQNQISRFAIASQNEPRINAMISLARPRMAITHEELDSNPWLFNCHNGTINLRTGRLQPHRREDCITKITPVAYDEEAEAPTFEEFLQKILPSEPIRRFVQRALGMAMVGEVLENVLVIFWGGGANGKSTLVNAVMEALGEYAIAGAPDLLMSKGYSHPTELADLFGARFVSCMESDEGRRLNEGLVKQLTGKDTIKARRMREDPWEFTPAHTIFLGTNHKPEIHGTDLAIWRRLKLVPFEVTIPKHEQDPNLASKLSKELPGILRWLVEGCLAWQEDGTLQEPRGVTAATNSYKADMDVLEQFLEECCITKTEDGGEPEAPATPLYLRYQQWCERAGERPLKQRAFGTRLGERGYVSFKFTDGAHKDRKGWRGIGLRADERLPSEPHLG